MMANWCSRFLPGKTPTHEFWAGFLPIRFQFQFQAMVSRFARLTSLFPAIFSNKPQAKQKTKSKQTLFIARSELRADLKKMKTNGKQKPKPFCICLKLLKNKKKKIHSTLIYELRIMMYFKDSSWGPFLLLIRISTGKWMEQLFFVLLCLTSQETIYDGLLNVKAVCKWSRGGGSGNCWGVEWKLPIVCWNKKRNKHLLKPASGK